MQSAEPVDFEYGIYPGRAVYVDRERAAPFVWRLYLAADLLQAAWPLPTDPQLRAATIILADGIGNLRKCCTHQVPRDLTGYRSTSCMLRGDVHGASLFVDSVLGLLQPHRASATPVETRAIVALDEVVPWIRRAME